MPTPCHPLPIPHRPPVSSQSTLARPNETVDINHHLNVAEAVILAEANVTWATTTTDLPDTTETRMTEIPPDITDEIEVDATEGFMTTHLSQLCCLLVPS